MIEPFRRWRDRRKCLAMMKHTYVVPSAEAGRFKAPMSFEQFYAELWPHLKKKK